MSNVSESVSGLDSGSARRQREPEGPQFKYEWPDDINPNVSWQELNQVLHTKYEQKFRTINNVFTVSMQDQKQLAIGEAIDFLIKQGGFISKTMTNEHRQLVQQFLEFKIRTMRNVKAIDEFQEKRVEAELRWANAAPVWEAEYSFEQPNALQLYDCLIPKLRDQRRLLVNTTTDDWVIYDNNKALAAY